MSRFHQQRRAVAAAAAAGSAVAAILAYDLSRSRANISSASNNSDHHNTSNADTSAKTLVMAQQQYSQHAPTLNRYKFNPSRPWFASTSTARCEAMNNNNGRSSADMGLKDRSAVDTTSAVDETQNVQIDHYYMKMDPNDVERTSLLDSHAVFGALYGEGLIERYNVYRRVNVNANVNPEQQNSSKRELAVVDLKLGSRLNGHGGIAHGGIISLLFDEAMGWACVCLQQEQNGKNDNVSTTSTTTTAAVTANLTVDFRAPFYEGSEAVVRVYHDETNGRKINFSATLESKDGSVVFAEAKSLFILVRSDRLNRK